MQPNQIELQQKHKINVRMLRMNSLLFCGVKLLQSEHCVNKTTK